MRGNSVEFPSLDRLVEHVRLRLCHRQDLQPHEYPLQSIPLVRQGNECGVLFVQHGPRLTRLFAVWDYAEATLHYYDCNGTRFCSEHVRIQLENSEELGRRDAA